MKTLLLLIIQLYFSVFPRQSAEALDFVAKNAPAFNKELFSLSGEERLIATSIVAPEISQFSSVVDFVELRALFVMYRNFGKGDFSVGYFQMKPSFIEALEGEIRKNQSLKRKYSAYLLPGDNVDSREKRLDRLSTLEWQLKYLQVFIDVVKLKTRDIKFKTPEEKLRYWATLYNSGFNLSPQRVSHYQKQTFFPHGSRKFNYADVAAEFYRALQSRSLP